ncbi:hypothetical protein AnigIFM63309_001267 [Aspergillus niger]|nr:hypothetical protein AnigIFM63309_001267 [Aspergillus niger]
MSQASDAVISQGCLVDCTHTSPSNVIRIPNSICSASDLAAVVGHTVNLLNVRLTKFLHLAEPMEPAKPWGPSTKIPVLFVWSSLHPQVLFTLIVSLKALVKAIKSNPVRHSGHLRPYRQPDYGYVQRISSSDVPEDWKCTKALCTLHRVENEPLRTVYVLTSDKEAKSLPFIAFEVFCCEVMSLA